VVVLVLESAGVGGVGGVGVGRTEGGGGSNDRPNQTKVGKSSCSV